MRDRILTARGLRIMRFTNERIYSDLTAVLKEIQAAAATNKVKSLPDDQT